MTDLLIREEYEASAHDLTGCDEQPAEPHSV